MIDDFTLPNYKMKDCQTAKYDWLDCERAGEDCLIDLLGGSMGGAGRTCQTHARSARNRHARVTGTENTR